MTEHDRPTRGQRAILTLMKGGWRLSSSSLLEPGWYHLQHPTRKYFMRIVTRPMFDSLLRDGWIELGVRFGRTAYMITDAAAIVLEGGLR